MTDQEAFDLFRKVGADFAARCHQLQVTPDELVTIFLLIIARDAGVALPDTFSQLTTNYAAFLAGTDFNDEKRAIANYLSFMETDLQTFQYVLCTLIAQKRAIAGIESSFNSLPNAPYIPPTQKRP
jgi:hypothetical protein